ncbi:hypothetical protein K3495_g7450 [Podosphaera aphanis]|nr:hypothetical protein K3495_g7450 [Podosphaera aphanis]
MEITRIDVVERQWPLLLHKNNLSSNNHLFELYIVKKKWFQCYVKEYLTGSMSTTGRSESTNSFFDDYFTRTTAMIEFAKRFEDAVRDRNLARVKKDIERKNQVLKPMTTMVIEAFALETYSLYAYEIFKEQMMLSLGYNCVESSASSLIVQLPHGTKGERVIFEKTTLSFSCSCKFLSNRGILCRHVIRCLQHLKYNVIPLQYVLKRWRWNTAPPVLMTAEKSLAKNLTATVNTSVMVTTIESATSSQVMMLQNPHITANKGRPKGRQGRLKAHHEKVHRTCGICEGKSHDRRTCSSRVALTSNTSSTITADGSTHIEPVNLESPVEQSQANVTINA